MFAGSFSVSITVLTTVVAVALLAPCGTLVFADNAASTISQADIFSGHWEGEIRLHSRPTVGLKIDLKVEDQKWRGTVVLGGSAGTVHPIDEVLVHDRSIVLKLGNQRFYGRLNSNGVIDGMTSVRTEFWLTRGKYAGSSEPSRPQAVGDDVPYDEEEVAYRSDGDIVIGGTLTLPRPASVRSPAIILVNGSGPDDRNEEFSCHQPFQLLADRLTRLGFAVLRVDDRGVGDSTGVYEESTIEDLEADLKVAIAFVRHHRRINGDRITLIGLSLGGVVAAKVASENPSVNGLIALSTPALPLRDVFLQQGEDTDKDLGYSDNQIAARSASLRQTYDSLANRAGELGSKDRGKTLERSLLRYDPTASFKRLRIPLLAIFGDRDRNIDARKNYSAMQHACEAAGNHDVTMKLLPGLNHMLQSAKTGSLEEMATIPETMSPVALDAISAWLLASEKRTPAAVPGVGR